MKSPRVSIIVPTRNRTTLLQETLESLQSQTYQNIEILVSDNASTTPVKPIVDAFPKATYFRHEDMLSMAEHWNHMVAQSQGELVAIFHDDDIYPPDLVEKSVALFNDHENVSMTHAKTIHFKGNWQDADANISPLHPAAMSHLEYLDFLLDHKPTIICSSVVYRRELFQKYRFKEEIKSFDYHLWLEILQERGSIGYVRDSHFFYRKHDNNAFKQHNALKALQEYRDIFLKTLTTENKQRLRRVETRLQENVAKQALSMTASVRDFVHLNRIKQVSSKLAEHEIELPKSAIYQFLWKKVMGAGKRRWNRF